MVFIAYERKRVGLSSGLPVSSETRPLPRYLSPTEHYRGTNIFSEIFTPFHFPQKSKMAAKSGENRNFSPLHRTLLYYLAGQNFARNRTNCYGFRDIHTFSFSAKIQDGRQKWRKSKFYPFAQDTLVLPCGSKIRSKSLYLLRFSRYSHFFIYRKNPRWPPKVAKIEIFRLCTGHSCTTLRVKTSLEIAVSVTVFEIFTLFHFPQKSKMKKSFSFYPFV